MHLSLHVAYNYPWTFVLHTSLYALLATFFGFSFAHFYELVKEFEYDTKDEFESLQQIKALWTRHKTYI
jgi:hypothetical protein